MRMDINGIGRWEQSSDIKSVKVQKGSFVSFGAADMDSYADKFGNKAVKKTRTIPVWMETYVEKHKISCSKVLQKALGEMISARSRRGCHMAFPFCVAALLSGR